MPGLGSSTLHEAPRDTHVPGPLAYPVPWGLSRENWKAGPLTKRRAPLGASRTFWEGQEWVGLSVSDELPGGHSEREGFGW